VFRSREDQWKVVVQNVRAVHATGRPVLIGTDSVADSESLSRELTTAGFAHAVLNARYDSSEAEIVSRAGEIGRITVATNMAGRGTDIVLTERVVKLGGLHVICCQHNAARRIDRQLQGRCARRGEPGSVETLLSLDSPLIARALPSWIRVWIHRHEELRPRWLVAALAAWIQRSEERRQRAQREHLFKQDLLLDRRLFFSGPGE
jgi:preprotein translocase subunit SecA